MAKERAAKRALPAGNDPDPSKSTLIANSLLSARRRRRLTLAQLAEATGLDKGYLSRIERGQKSPSIGTLLKIAEALEVQVGHLFGETTADDAILVVRRDEHLEMQKGSPTGTESMEAVLPPGGSRRLSIFLVEPGQETDQVADHPGEEAIFVLSGALSVAFPDRVIDLTEGDCVHFDGHLRHKLRLAEGGAARALVVVAQDVPRRP